MSSDIVINVSQTNEVDLDFTVSQDRPIDFELKQESVIKDFEVVISTVGGLSRVSHTEDFTGDGTVNDPLGLSETFIANIDGKLDKVDIHSIVYGTDDEGNQVTYNVDSFGKIEDVQVKFAGSEEYESIVFDKIAQLDLTSSKVDYTFDATPDIISVKEALDDLMNRQYYVEPSFSVFQIRNSSTDTYENNKSYERRNTAFDYAEVKWTLNKTPTNADILQIRTGAGAGGGVLVYDIIANEPSNKWKSGNYVIPNFSSLNQNKTYYIYYEDRHTTVPSGKGRTANRSVSITYYITQYYGATATENPLDSQFRTLTNRHPAERELNSTAFDFGDGKYFYYAIPKETDIGKPLMFYIGAAGSEALMSNNYFIYEMDDFKNAQNYVVPMRIYKFKKTPEGLPDRLGGMKNVKVGISK